MLNESPALDRTFAALADPTRREILRVLVAGEVPVARLAQRFPISGPAISRHLRVLEDAGLVTRRVAGKQRPVRLDPAPIRTALEWLEFYRRFWTESLQQLADLFDQENAHDATRPNPQPPKHERKPHARRRNPN